MKSSWPDSFYYQIALFVACLLLGAFLIDGLKSALLIPYLLCIIPSIIFMILVNEPTDFLSHYLPSSGQQDQLIAIAGLKIPVVEKEDLVEERYLKVHGDFVRRAKRMLGLWGQIGLTYMVMALSGLGPSPGMISLGIAGVVMILSFGRGHLLIALVIQGLLILLQFQQLTLSTPFLLVAYLILFFSFLSLQRFSKLFLIRPILASLLFVSIFLCVDWIMPSKEIKWGEQVVKMAESKVNAKRTHQQSVANSDNEENLDEQNQQLEQNDQLAGSELSYEQIIAQLDQFESLLKQGNLSAANSSGLNSAEVVSSLRKMKHAIRTNRAKGMYSEEQLRELTTRVESLSQDFNQALDNGLIDQSEAQQLPQLEDELHQLKSSLAEKSAVLQNDYGQMEKANQIINKKDEIKNKKTTFSKWRMVITLVIGFIVFLFLRSLFKKSKHGITLSEEEQEILHDIQKEYRRAKRRWKSREEEVRETYRIVHRGIEKLYYRPIRQFAPPPEILAQAFKLRQEFLLSLALIFSKVQYGGYPVSIDEIKHFRKAFRGAFLR